MITLKKTYKNSIKISLAVTLIISFICIGLSGASPSIITDPSEPVSLEAGESVEVSLSVDQLPDGLSGYKLTVVLDEPAVATIESVSFPSWVTLDRVSELPDSSVSLKAMDLQRKVQKGSKDTKLVTITLKGLSGGSTGITVTESMFEDDMKYADGDESSQSSSSSTGGGSGSGSTSGENYENIAYKDVLSEFVSKNNMTSYEFDDEQNAIEYIRFQALRNWGKISSTIEMLHNRSALVDVDAPDTVYCNVNMWIGESGFSSSGNIEDSVVGFRVEKRWIEENNIDRDTIRLCRYSSGSWNDLDTRMTSEDDRYIHFEADTPGFSPFAIVGAPVKNTTTEELRSTEESPEDSNLPEEEVPVETKSDFSNLTIIGSMSILLIGGCAGYLMYRKRS